MSEAVSEAVAGEARAFNAKLEAMLATQPSVHTLPAELVRAARRAGKGIFPPPVFLPDATWVDANGVKLRVVRPPGPARGVYLHIHGGGWTLGAADMQDLYLRDLARATGLVAASVEYRLAPEHPFPSGRGRLRGRRALAGRRRRAGARGPADLAIGGESAGAHLAALILVRLRTGFSAGEPRLRRIRPRHDPEPARLGRPQPRAVGSDHRYFAAASCRALARAAPRPAISPLFADLAVSPRAVHRRHARSAARRLAVHGGALAVAGNATTLRVWPQAVHGFNGFALALGGR